jgi:hypothetical protein
VDDVIELRKRVLSSGFVVLEFKQSKPVFGSGNLGATVIDHEWSDWAIVPYVDEQGDPHNSIPEHTG